MDQYGNIYVIRNVFDKNFVNTVINQHDNNKLGTSYIYNGDNTNRTQADLDYRSSMQCNVIENHEITQSIARIVKQINNECLHINVSQYCTENHFLKYPPTGHFKKHHDVVYGHGTVDHDRKHIRKITAICLLSDVNTFEGGKLAFFSEDKKRFSCGVSRGDVVVFPSYVMHQVDPITAGVRYSTVHWSYGGF